MPKHYVDTTPMRDSKSYLTNEQFNKLLLACKNNRDKLLLLVLITTGRRISEVVGGRWKVRDGVKECEGLKPKDINFKENLINWNILKKRHPLQSIKPVSLRTIRALKQYIELKKIPEDQRVFPISRQRADQIIKRVAKDAGIEYVGSGTYNKPHLHLLRHSFLVEGAKKAKTPQDIILLKQMAEHSNINTTMFYLKFNPKEERELLKRMWTNEEE